MAHRIVSASLPVEVADRLRQFARADDRSMSYVVRKSLERTFEKSDDAVSSAVARSSAVQEPSHDKA